MENNVSGVTLHQRFKPESDKLAFPGSKTAYYCEGFDDHGTAGTRHSIAPFSEVVSATTCGLQDVNFASSVPLETCSVGLANHAPYPYTIFSKA